MVPSGNRIISSNETCGESKRQSLRCGKQKDIILKQLMELSKRELMEMDCNGGGGEKEGPAVLNRMDVVNQPLQQLEKGNCDQIFEGNLLWDIKPNCKGAQIWDFHLGRSRGREESGSLEVGYCANDAGFTMQSYVELLKKASLASGKGFGEIYGVNCTTDTRGYQNIQ
ncbi:Zinc finger protein like, partial [Actinidia chinensis var. chinensis]